MNLSLWVGHAPVEVIKTTFPAGESCIRIKDPTYGGVFESSPKHGKLNVCITLAFKDNGDLFDLILLVDAIKRFYTFNELSIALKLPYLPYARQDRVMVDGESLSVKVVADLINSLNFSAVYCWDIHSNVGVALIDNLMHTKLSSCAWQLPRYEPRDSTVLVSPDAGAEKKVFDFAKDAGYTSVIRASKVRNVATGKIEKTVLIDEVFHKAGQKGKNLLIVDDICDGGRTFIELAKVLNHEYNSGYRTERNTVKLYVTHGIFSAGVEVFEGYLDKIYVHNLMNEAVKDSPLIQII